MSGPGPGKENTVIAETRKAKAKAHEWPMRVGAKCELNVNTSIKASTIGKGLNNKVKKNDLIGDVHQFWSLTNLVVYDLVEWEAGGRNGAWEPGLSLAKIDLAILLPLNV